MLYYTANRISDFFGGNIRDHLKSFKLPIVSVSQKPMKFGENICVGKMEYCPYSIYTQILTGAKQVKTKYVVCCEDDSMYNEEHFSMEPPEDTFFYNVNRWNVNPKFYFYRRRAGMCMCVVATKLLVETLERRFEKYPDPIPRYPKVLNFGEPGRCEKALGLPKVKMRWIKTEMPTLTFNHRPSLGGKRRLLKSDILVESLEPWGTAKDLWAKYHR